MAQEIKFIASGITAYVLIFTIAGDVWSNYDNAFVPYVAEDIGGYAVYANALDDNYYTADFPTAISVAGHYEIGAYKQAGGSPADSDPTIAEGAIEWDGSAEVGPSDSDLISLAYLKMILNITDSANDDRLHLIITAASKAIFTYCRVSNFHVETYTEDCEGNDDCTLQLRNYPVVSLGSVSLNVYGSPEVIDGANFIVDGRLGRITSKPSSNRVVFFYSGIGVRHQVVYDAGYNPIPADLQQACAMICRNLYTQASQQQTITSEKIGDYAVTYSAAVVFISKNYSVQEVLDSYRRLI